MIFAELVCFVSDIQFLPISFAFCSGLLPHKDDGCFDVVFDLLHHDLERVALSTASLDETSSGVDLIAPSPLHGVPREPAVRKRVSAGCTLLREKGHHPYRLRARFSV